MQFIMSTQLVRTASTLITPRAHARSGVKRSVLSASLSVSVCVCVIKILGGSAQLYTNQTGDEIIVAAPRIHAVVPLQCKLPVFYLQAEVITLTLKWNSGKRRFSE